MKNSKVLSLLTAGALVVSSFSGLAINGGVARAALQTTKSANITGTGSTYYNATDGYQVLKDDTFTVTVPAEDGKFGFGWYSANEPGNGAAARVNAVTQTIGANAAAIVPNASFSTLKGVAGAATYDKIDVGDDAFIAIGHADAVPAADATFPAASTDWWRVTVGETPAAVADANILFYQDI